MTTPLFLLRCVQLGISIADLDLLTIGLVNDMFTERQNDDYPYKELHLNTIWMSFRTISGNPRQFNYRDESVNCACLHS